MQVYNPQLLRGAVADEPILRLLLHLLIVFKTFVVLFLNSALLCLVDCAHLILAAARPNFFLSKKNCNEHFVAKVISACVRNLESFLRSVSEK